MRMLLPLPQREAQPAQEPAQEQEPVEPELLAALEQLQQRPPHSRNVLRMQRNTISWTWN